MSITFYPSNANSDRYTSGWNESWLTQRETYDVSVEETWPLIRRLFPLNGELEFSDGHKWTLFMRQYWWLSFAAVAIYLVGVFGGRRLMANREPFSLKPLLAMWNLALAVFSWIGTLRMLPVLVYGTYMNGSVYFVCRASQASYGYGPAGLWVGLFMWSKYFELVDTAFLVLRKKPVSFLHWFHHATVLLYCWHAGQYESSTGIYFAVMNYMVHGVMYFYYFLAAVTKPPKWGLFVTTIQIMQMFAGMFITALHYYSLRSVPNCDGSYSNLMAAFVMYTIYMLLFVQFFVGRYWRKKNKTE